MATPVTNVREYCTLLIKSKLLLAEEVESLYQRWKDERPGRSDDRVDSFRRFLIAKKALTDYQAALIQRGRTDGFFLGGYKILDRVGKGQMGGVYKAVHNYGQLVALKILPASKAKDAHLLGRFQREARLLTQLDHPNVVRAYQVGEAAGVHYIVMEYLEGETLDEILVRRGQLPLPEAVRLIRQALDGLQHLHERRMVHRDFKPANIMLVPGVVPDKPDTTWDATVKILDIGLGREMFDEETPEGQIETQLTQEGSVLGTPDYLAPEQAKDARSADIRADIYSAGCVLYHCLVGRAPFPDTNIMTQMLRHATEMPVPVSTFIADVPAGFEAVLERFLAKTPDKRYQTPADASAALAPFSRGGAPASGAKIIPAFKEWLESESHLEMPKELLLPGTKPTAPLKLAPPQPPTAPSPSLKPDTAPAPPVKPAGPPKPVAVPPKPQPPTPQPLTASKPLPNQVFAPTTDEVNVELITEPVPSPAIPPELVQPATPPVDRPFWPPDRRDWLMLTSGAAGVLLAVGLGYGLARALRKKPEIDDPK